MATQDEHRQQRKERQRKGTAAAQGTAAPVWLVLGSPSCSSAANAVPTFAINCCGPVVSRPRKRPRKRLRKRLRTDCASGTVETQRNAEKGSGERQRGSDRGRDGQQHVAADAPPPPPSPPSSSGSPPARSRGTLKSGKRLPTCHLFGCAETPCKCFRSTENGPAFPRSSRAQGEVPALLVRLHQLTRKQAADGGGEGGEEAGTCQCGVPGSAPRQPEAHGCTRPPAQGRSPARKDRSKERTLAF